ncbi:VOC family protein [Candidatus Roizmanbacteria bacterium]|nr:VOC family protein [Candidatus Roizmanbacteria bacterium]
MAVRYIVDNVEKAVKFYTSYLGFFIKNDWGPVVILNANNLELWLSGPLSSAGKTVVDGYKPTPGGSNKIVVEIKNLEKQIDKLKRNGVRIISETVKGPAGRWVVISDPSGNPVELFEKNKA